MSLYQALTEDYQIEERKPDLTPEQVRDIRKLYTECDWRQVDIADHFGVNQSTVSRIVNRKRRQGVE